VPEEVASGEPQFWEVSLIVETADQDELERIADALLDLGCPLDDKDHAGPCGRRWLVVTTKLNDDDVAGWLPALND
jgi:hypothetical protein